MAQTPQRKKEYQREYYLINKEHFLAYSKKYFKNKHTPKRRSNEERMLRKMVTSAKSRAAKEKIEFNITYEDLILPKVCPLLGIELNQKDRMTSASIDRINNSGGYVRNYVWVISYKANLMKNNASIKEWKTFCINSLRTIEYLPLN